VSDTRDELVRLPHRVDELPRSETSFESTGEFGSGTVESSSESVTDSEETGNERRNEVLSSTSSDDGVHGTRDGRSLDERARNQSQRKKRRRLSRERMETNVISGKHENHFEELASVIGKTTLEPKKGNDTSDTDVLLEDVRDPHASVKEFLSTFVRDGRDESGGFTNHAEFLSPLVVDGDRRSGDLSLGRDGTLRNEFVVGLLEDLRKVFEGRRNDESSSTHGVVLGFSSFEVRVGHGTCVTELNVGSEHLGASSDSPGDDRLLDLTRLDSFDDTVLFDTTDFSEEDEHLAVGVSLVSKEMVDEGSSGVSVSSDGDTFVGTVGRERENVVEFVRHSSGFRNVTDRSSTVKLGRENVVHHTVSDTPLVSIERIELKTRGISCSPSSVTNSEATRLDSSDGSGTDDDNVSLLGSVKDVTSVTFGDTFSDESDSLDLREFESFESRLVNGSGRGEVDADVGIRALLYGIGHRGEDGEEGFLSSPVELLNVVTSEGVDHGSY